MNWTSAFACYIQIDMAEQKTPEENLAALGISLPPAPTPAGNYVAAKQIGNLLYLSGAISADANGVITGTAGAGRTAVDGYAAARACALTQLAVIKRELGSLDRVAEIVSLTGYVSAAPGFADSSSAINGASDLLAHVFGDAGRHVRVAVGVSALPRNALAEVQLILRVRD